MNLPRQIDLIAALALVQAMIGEPVDVYLNLPGYLFDCGFTARLQRVVTLAEPDGPLLIVFERGQAIVIDPTDVRAFVDRVPTCDGVHWLEFQIGDRASLLIIAQADPAAA